ncbi:MAG: hypothetical protein JO041_11545 [Acidobacteria bacterium]|nr:hypothetical protein [Acidobacteriota bacterium]
MPYFLGIDGGGSKTSAVLGDAGRERARAEGPSCKIQNVGEAAARAALQEVILQACRKAGIRPEDITAATVGISGASDPEITKRLSRLVSDLTGARVQVVGDNVVALEAAFGPGPGVVVIAGTGSIAHGRNQEGLEARAGGFGPAISDEGSGVWIGRRAVRAAAAGESPELARAALALWQLSSVAELVARANAVPAAEFARLFPSVVAAAAADDPAALRVLQEAARELAVLAKAVISRLWAGASVQVAMAGGVFANSEQVRSSFRDQIHRFSEHLRVSEAVADPALGALALARRGAACC